MIDTPLGKVLTCLAGLCLFAVMVTSTWLFGSKGLIIAGLAALLLLWLALYIEADRSLEYYYKQLTQGEEKEMPREFGRAMYPLKSDALEEVDQVMNIIAVAKATMRTDEATMLCDELLGKASRVKDCIEETVEEDWGPSEE